MLMPIATTCLLVTLAVAAEGASASKPAETL